MFFLSAVPLEINRDYALKLSAEAHDREGLSMDNAFEGRFSTRPESGRPVLLSIYPVKDAIVTDLRTEPVLVFSRSMSVNSLRENVSFSPAMTGTWRLTNEGSTAVFTPAEPWIYGGRYEIHLSASLAGSDGLAMGRDFISVFTAGDDHGKPFLVDAWRITEWGGPCRLAADAADLFAENNGWEGSDRLKLVFSKPVDALSVRNCLSVEGAPSLVMETPPAPADPEDPGSEHIFRFESVPVFASRFYFKLKTGVRDRNGSESENEYTFRIAADGCHSKPPELVGIRLPMAPGNAGDQNPVSFGRDSLFAPLPLSETPEGYPSSTDTGTWIECYFETALGASIVPLSLMESFRVETTNNALTFSPRQVKTSGFSVSAPGPGWEYYERLEIRGVLTNTTNFGVVNIQIAPGLRDSFGNRNEKTFRISLVK
jgi:hypothetical protein